MFLSNYDNLTILFKQKTFKMKLKLLFTVFMISICGYLFAQEVANAPKPIPDQYIVVMKESFASPLVKSGKKNNDREQKAKDNQGKRDESNAKTKEFRGKKGIEESSVLANYADLFVGFTAKMPKNKADELSDDPDVESVVQDAIVNLGPIQQETLAPPSGANFVACAIQRAGGPGPDATFKGTWIWILDTGIDMTHPDLNVQTNALWAKSFTGEAVNDGNGHGTHVAGIAAARANTFGVTGVSPGAKVVPVKVLSNAGSGAWSWILSGLNHVAMYDIPGDVVNMSLGAYPVSNCPSAVLSITYAIQNLGLAGTWVCIAAGNSYGNSDLSYPGCVNGTRVATVGALICDLTCAPYSNFGPGVDYYAVGTSVTSTYKGGTYATLSGTSMATPVVAGIIHSRGGAPLAGAGINCKGFVKPLARRL